MTIADHVRISGSKISDRRSCRVRIGLAMGLASWALLAPAVLIAPSDQPMLEIAYQNNLISNATIEAIFKIVGAERFSRALTLEVMSRLVDAGLTITPTSQSGSQSVTKAVTKVASPSTYSMASATPYLPFVGHRSVLVGAVLSADGNTLSDVALRRQADCSVVLDITQPNAATPNAGLVARFGGAQNYLHQLAGLTTTGNLFAAGCNDSALGRRSVNTAAPLGSTATIAQVAGLNPSTDVLQVLTANSASNTYATVSLTQTGVRSLYVADLNGDGNADIVANGVRNPATQQSGVAVFLGGANGAFQPGVYYDNLSESAFFTVDDFNRDGKPDVVLVNGTGGGVTTLLGNGDGTLAAPVASAVGVTIAGQALVAGDFNGDGVKDLFAGQAVLLGAGNGSFTAGPVLAANLQQATAPYVEAADLNHDGKLDLSFSSPGALRILLGNGNGTFSAGAGYASVPAAQPVMVTDLDGDGNPDIVVGNSAPGLHVPGLDNPPFPMIQVLMGRGDGTFSGAPLYGGAYPNDPQTSAPQVALADLTGDGRIDAVVMSPNVTNAQAPSALQVLPGDGTGKTGAAISSPINLFPTMLIAADMNGDSRTDVVVAGNAIGGGAPVVSVLFNQGNGALATEQDYALANLPANLVAADFNGDGRTDIAVAVAPQPGQSGTSGVYVLLAQSNGSFAAPAAVDASLRPVSLAAGDVNGDGRADLLVGDQGVAANRTGTLKLYLGRASGGFDPGASLTTNANFYNSAAMADLNGDGNTDLIVSGTVGRTLGAMTPAVYVMLGNGNGTFRPATSETLAGTDGLGATSLALADFNGDGTPDIAVGNPNNYVEIMLSTGGGAYAHTVMLIGQQPNSLAAAKLSGSSGFADLVVGGGAFGTAVFVNPGSAAAWAANAAAAPPPAGSFSVQLSAAALSVAAGQSAQTTVTVTPGSGFSQPVALSCAGLPAGAACTFSPATLTPAAGTTMTSTLTISTTGASASTPSPTSLARNGPALPPALLPTAVMALVGFSGGASAVRRRGGPKKRRVALLVLATLLLAACGGGGGGDGGGASQAGAVATPPGTYAVSVTATAGGVAQSTVYTLTVR